MSGHWGQGHPPPYAFNADDGQNPMLPPPPPAQPQQQPQQAPHPPSFQHMHAQGLPSQPGHPFHQLPQLQTVGSSEHLRGQFGGFEPGPHASPTSASSATSARQRKRQGTGSEVKHRRTRSGCFTCRNRRVKCDETHPICDRCRKGNRECVYPEPTSATRIRPRPKTGPHESESSGEEPESAIRETLPSIPDDEELPASATTSDPPGSATTSRRDPSKTPSLTYDKSPSPSTEGSANLAAGASRFQPRATSKSGGRPPSQRTWNELPQHVRSHLTFYKENLSHHHYGFKYDGANFLKTTYLEIAIRFEPLLYGVTGFAAYHHALARPDGKIQDFLGYYNRSVTLLRMSLRQSPRPTIATLLTILQLATMEEFLGDWVSLLSHQKAAYEILTTLFNPRSIMQNETLRKILQWYIRFDLFAGLMSGYEPILGREWFDGAHDYYLEQTRQFPDVLQWKFEERQAAYRLVCNDMASVFGRRSRGLINEADFIHEVEQLQEKIVDWERNMDPALLDPQKFLQDFPTARPRPPDDIVNPFEPGTFYGDDLFAINFAMIDYYAIRVMFHAQLSNCYQRPVPPEVMQYAYKVCQVFEGVELYAHSPPGAVLAGHSSLGVAAMYLPKDERHSMWVRRKFAMVESKGYIFPVTFRDRMCEILGADVKHWWLPNEEGLPRMLRSLREFVSDRSTDRPRDQDQEENIREMKGLFNNMSLEQTPSPPNQAHSQSQSPQQPQQRAITGSGDKGKRPEQMKGPPEYGEMTYDDSLDWNDSPEYGWALNS